MGLFLLDENVPVDLGRALAARGHDVTPIPANLRASDDRVVLALAASLRRALVTLDTDFGGLVFLLGQAPPPAVVLIRLPPSELVWRIEAVATAIELATVHSGSFIVIDGQGVRMRPLPS